MTQLADALRVRRFFHEGTAAVLCGLIALHPWMFMYTFGWFLWCSENWTWINALPRIVVWTVLSASWFLFWPCHFLFG